MSKALSFVKICKVSLKVLVYYKYLFPELISNNQELIITRSQQLSSDYHIHLSSYEFYRLYTAFKPLLWKQLLRILPSANRVEQKIVMSSTEHFKHIQ